jgi:beta-lactamase superfamily II metal-dependent hydrolase
MTARLGIHVIGPRYGESIILELPDGGVGVIDSFAATKGLHPVVAFLKTRFPALNGLRFLAITHPHADHCFRVADILGQFPPEEIWVFRPFPAGQVQQYYLALKRCGARDKVEDSLGLPAGSVAISLLQLDKLMREPVRRRQLIYRPLAYNSSFNLCGGSVRIHFVTPGALSQFTYASQVEDAGRAILEDGASLVRSSNVPQPDHNLASGAILIEWGRTRALLMSDAESPRWTEWLDTEPPCELCTTVQFLKASHHGSENGYLKRLYDSVANPSVTLAVITPFNHGQVCLPSPAGVQSLRPHVRELYCTNRIAAERSTGLTWAPGPLPPLPSLPAKWAGTIRQNHLLTQLLVPEAGVPGPVGNPPPLPTAWIFDAHANPALWRLVRPELRQATPTPNAVASHTVSAYYDGCGNLLLLETGEEVGQLIL